MNSSKIYIAEGEVPPLSQIGAALDCLAATIESRKSEGRESSYTRILLQGKLDDLCKKVSEEAAEAGLAAKEAEMLNVYSNDEAIIDFAVDHLRYEAADIVYHLMVLLSRFNISMDEFAAELNERMTDEERPSGAARLVEGHIKRGK
ncbi:phosphoribosyl-ATP diphosphatase [Adlercreutzia sp. ZJ304]|uniref:phosphoribosyl-ATP diphosphatase n=1 Tax=Adlercreutzia sp. ZJ304 TaxID=2709791 RepID=UPI0013E9E862|nr:phosphoribosyl-ATP diphosphatase [Adlercreutzia sp. ZJ304]